MTAPVLVTGIYRRKHAAAFAERLRRWVPDEWPVALWALDGTDGALAARTVGEGPGQKFDLVNDILERHPLPPGHHLAVVDDDVTIGAGGLRALVAIGERAAFDLWQPAHARRSHLSHQITRRRVGRIARETTFVEIGPVFVVAQGAVDSFVPFPEGMGMGWGLELLWRRTRAQGRRLGIVDVVTVRHPDVPNTTYTERFEVEERRLRALLAEDGLSDLPDAQEVLGEWRWWQPRPPWLTAR